MRAREDDGFTLLEIMLYLLFISFIAMLTASWMVRIWQISTARNAKQQSLMTLYTAHDMLLRDVNAAPADRKQWKEMELECIIWHTKAGDVGWQREQKQLIRREGRYHHNKKRWGTQTKNLIADDIDTVRFIGKGESEIEQVSFSIIAGTTYVEGVALPLCRRLPWKEEASKEERP
jgi:type II secretory pathway pseudopilin PulG